MNYVFIYGILAKKKFVHNSLHLLLPLISASWCHPYKTPAVVSQHIWTPLSNTSLFHLGNILMAVFAMFIRDRSHVCREKIQMEIQKMKFQWHVTPPSTAWWKQLLQHFYVLICLFHCLENFCRCSQMPFKLFFLQHLILHKSLGCLIFGPTKIPSFILASIILGNICLNP